VEYKEEKHSGDAWLEGVKVIVYTRGDHTGCRGSYSTVAFMNHSVRGEGQNSLLGPEDAKSAIRAVLAAVRFALRQWY